MIVISLFSLIILLALTFILLCIFLIDVICFITCVIFTLRKKRINHSFSDFCKRIKKDTILVRRRDSGIEDDYVSINVISFDGQTVKYKYIPKDSDIEKSYPPYIFEDRVLTLYHMGYELTNNIFTDAKI